MIFGTTLTDEQVSWLNNLKWKLGPEYDGCWTTVDFGLIANLSEKEAYIEVLLLKDRMQVEEVTVPPGYARFFRFTQRKPS